MSKIKVSFYLLSASKAQDFLGFICQLTQTALNKSMQSLVILVDDERLLAELDQALWTNEATSFIPHQRLNALNDNVDVDDENDNSRNADTSSDSLAPVLLGQQLPSNFSGIVINTTARPVNEFMAASNNAQPSRMLEIIQPDDTSVAQGRSKYKHYQQLNYELTHFKV